MDALAQLVEALRNLPGIGPKSAQRMAFYLLSQRQKGLKLAACLENAMQQVHHCVRCNNYSSIERCGICSNKNRDLNTLCIVENPADVAAIEHSRAFQGSYYVLMGRISPLDGMGADDIGLPKLQQLVMNEPIQEVILALSASVEGQTTAHVIEQLLTPHVRQISQLAHGIPSGGELEFLDGNTIGSALRNRAALAI